MVLFQIREELLGGIGKEHLADKAHRAGGAFDVQEDMVDVGGDCHRDVPSFRNRTSRSL